jgi:hypothetical protein
MDHEGASLACVERGTTDPSWIGGIHTAFRELAERAEELAPCFRQASPYPFLVIDDFLSAEVVEVLVRDFPAPGAEIWHRCLTADQHNKLALSHESLIPASIRNLIHELNSGYFLELLEQITGINNLVADTKLVGGGLHQIERGGKLNVHVDYSHHPNNRLNRRLNLILYLNENWREEYGGHFEIWDRKVRRCEHRIAPLVNRCVLFATSSYSFHGHPEPLACPEGMTRKSVALYYYSNGRPEEPGPVVEHNTLFHLRPGEQFSWNNFVVRLASSGWVRDLTPPLFYRWLRAGWNRRFRKTQA